MYLARAILCLNCSSGFCLTTTAMQRFLTTANGWFLEGRSPLVALVISSTISFGIDEQV